MTKQSPSGAPWRVIFGRTRGKRLRESQKSYLDDLAGLSPGPVSWDDNPDRTPLDLDAMFAASPVWLEIGFGSGEHLVHQAAANPQVGIIGAEPYINGVATLLGKIRALEAGNIRVHAGDARDLMDVLPAASIAKAFLLYPDPWPKKKHHQRRFVTQEHLVPLYRAMAPGAELRIATDIPDYVRQALVEVPKAGFRWNAEQASDWREPWPDWTRTRFEAKAVREGRVPHYLTFQKAR